MFTYQSREQLQVLFPDVQVETTVVQIHLRAATQGRSEVLLILNKQRNNEQTPSGSRDPSEYKR